MHKAKTQKEKSIQNTSERLVTLKTTMKGTHEREFKV